MCIVVSSGLRKLKTMTFLRLIITARLRQEPAKKESDKHGKPSALL